LIKNYFLNASFKRVVDETSERHGWQKNLKDYVIMFLQKGLVGETFWKVDDF
jgi:hypothetical protein